MLGELEGSCTLTPFSRRIPIPGLTDKRSLLLNASTYTMRASDLLRTDDYHCAHHRLAIAFWYFCKFGMHPKFGNNDAYQLTPQQLNADKPVAPPQPIAAFPL